MSKTRLAVLGLAALLMAGCGPVNPGAAAVVDGTRIPMSDVDDVADVYCTASLSGQGGSAAGIDSSALRRQSVADLVSGAVADRVAKERGYQVTVPALAAADREQLEQMFGDDLDAALELIERNQRTGVIAQQMAREADSSLQEGEALQQAGQQLLAQATADSDIEIDPRFGLDDTVQQIADSGSLSVAGGELDATATEDRPAALQCS
ncbi:hypothetical protein IDH50_02435 [Aeromicrobium tamlense]|uniref:SurA N-terminal domain-containing protein n=1 Tax=Aeromicrobium tamlense TaxID=375541 RepID=A0A8I0FUQ6_9ACTN|nr:MULTISPECIES: hypothetical protein [Aeromicrobium]MBD1269080.1 hypothetical protein [Aeromicrobium tamlense]NYI37011.1 hypothetical protein [Aeromicrobium tamlense]